MAFILRYMENILEIDANIILFILFLDYILKKLIKTSNLFIIFIGIIYIF